jgi:predicted aminopeptidase
MAAEGGDLPRFYARVKELARMPKGERDVALAKFASTVAAGRSSRP